MPAVVSDTSVINYLAAAGLTDLLRVQFGTIYIPPAVWRELHVGANLPGTHAADQAYQAGWLLIQEPTSAKLLATLLEELDPGEAEAIVLASEFNPATVLLDEMDGRMAARRLGLPVIGTAGILVAARRSGHLNGIKPILDDLMKNHRFRLSHELYCQLIIGDPVA